ncbi:MAG TPA: hypothetical protein ENG16_03995 [Archaeoglobus sp.]|nr:hypothetical protein [Archaeoglobus sp.]
MGVRVQAHIPVQVRDTPVMSVKEIEKMIKTLKLGTKVPKDVINKAISVLNITVDYSELGEVHDNYVIETSWKIQELLEAVVKLDKTREELYNAFEGVRNVVGKAWTDRQWRGSLTKKESRIATKIMDLEVLLRTKNVYLLRALRREHKKLLEKHGIKNVIVKRFKYGTWLFAIIPMNGIVDARDLPREFTGYLINRKQKFGIKFVKGGLN